MEYDELDDALEDEGVWGDMMNLVEMYKEHSKSTQNPSQAPVGGGGGSSHRGVVSMASGGAVSAKIQSLHPQPQPHRHFMATTPSRTRANREDDNHLVALFLSEVTGSAAAPANAATSVAQNLSSPRQSHVRPQHTCTRFVRTSSGEVREFFPIGVRSPRGTASLTPPLPMDAGGRLDHASGSTACSAVRCGSNDFGSGRVDPVAGSGGAPPAKRDAERGLPLRDERPGIKILYEGCSLAAKFPHFVRYDSNSGTTAGLPWDGKRDL
eukprot:2316017-Pyramimonas_sp.AAC.1